MYLLFPRVNLVWCPFCIRRILFVNFVYLNVPCTVIHFYFGTNLISVISEEAFFMSGVFCTNNAQAPSLFSNVTLTSRRSYVETVSGNSALLQSNIPFDWRRALLPETVSTYDRLLVSVTLEKREGACALFVQKTPDMFTNLPSARKTLLKHFLPKLNLYPNFSSGLADAAVCSKLLGSLLCYRNFLRTETANFGFTENCTLPK